MTRFALVSQSIRDLGLLPVMRNSFYRLLLKSGIYRTIMPHRPLRDEVLHGEFHPLPLPDIEKLKTYLAADSSRIFTEKELVCGGEFHPFGGKETAPIGLNPVNGSRHWATDHKVPVPDLKLVWEDARFCWVDVLIRSEVFSHSGLAEGFFWEKLEEFNQKNPVNLGENWESAQEVGIRLINIVLAASIFLQMPESNDIYFSAAKRTELTRTRTELAARMIQAHARRIPQTLIYAKSQRNNHLLSEAAALMTAAVVLPDAHDAGRWWRIGRNNFFDGLLDQIAPNGCYIQHSSNYHRLMLQLVIWVDQLLRLKGESWPGKLIPRLRNTVRFLYAFCDPVNGKCSNIGHNDGSLLFWFGCEHDDYSPTLQAAGQIFLGRKLFPNGPVNELSLWLNVEKRYLFQFEQDSDEAYIGPLSVGENRTKALLLAEPFYGRPAHDDRLHLDVWINGVNELCDAGTYRYSGIEGWDNRLKYAATHNVMTVDHVEPMTDAGKFLWLNPDEVKVLSRNEAYISAEHSGFLKQNLKHRRTVRPIGNGFSVTDDVIPLSKEEGEHLYRFHWLLPNQSFKYKKGVLVLDRIRLGFSSDTPFNIRIIRAGYCIFNSGTETGEADFREDQWCGWFSPTYNEKEPALSIIVSCKGTAPFHFDTLITRL
ncbi:MAG: alginate lyase family protein [Anaerolineaceae bacterium]|nr:alginate lyase family protein [Anaerolineaceae bacterium]